MSAKLDLTGNANYTITGPLTLTGTASGTPTSSNENGILVADGDSPSDRVFIDRFDLRSFNGAGVKHSASSGNLIAHHFTRIDARGNYIGIEVDTGNYGSFTDCFLNGNQFGVKQCGGNATHSGHRIISNLCGIWLKHLDGGNDAHGQFIGCAVNHNTYALIADGILNGETFVGCHFISNDAGIVIQNGSRGIEIMGGQIWNTPIVVKDGSQLILRGVIYHGTVAVTGESGSEIDAKDCKIADGATVTLNGSAWSGNTTP